MPAQRPRALLVDLNNFAAYPTLAVGYLVAALRNADIGVEVLSPLHYGVAPALREPPEDLTTRAKRRVNLSSNWVMTRAHEVMRDRRVAHKNRPGARVLEEVRTRLAGGSIDVLLLSAYLEHYPSVKALAAIASQSDVPTLVGGPMFNLPRVARSWVGIPGVTAVVGAEVDTTLADLVHATVDRRPLEGFPGVSTSAKAGEPAPPLRDLSALPVPDLSDFPWSKYPRRIIPLMAGRGCAWGRCLFCSDVITANGRDYRSRPAEAILDEMVEQAARYNSRDFNFLDIKLNSHVPTWRTLIEEIPRRLPGARWVGTVHVQARGDNGLTNEDLRAAKEAGMQRISFGLETGSQAINNAMAKGTTLERTSEFLEATETAGLSVRTTMMLGYPGEQAHDVRDTARFVRTHEGRLDRVKMSRFEAIADTRFDERYTARPERYPDLHRLRWDHRNARAAYRNRAAADRGYRHAKSELLNLVDRINRRPLPTSACHFEGVM